MYDVIIFIVSAGPNVIKENIAETVYSISKNIGDDVKYGFYIVTDNKTQEKFVKDTLFSRLLKKGCKPTVLQEQYRMPYNLYMYYYN